MNLVPSTVSIAPLGTAPGDEQAWTPIGFTDGELRIEPATNGDSPLFSGDDWPMTTAITMAFTVARLAFPFTLFTPLPCRDTLHRIHEHARVQRISRLLAEALAKPTLLPCPRPF